MLDLGDLLTLIRLTEIEIFELQKAIDGSDEIEKNNAGEIIIQIDNLAKKLQSLYESQWSEDSDYPSYHEFISAIKNHPPFLVK